jgi:hypothetical protein
MTENVVREVKQLRERVNKWFLWGHKKKLIKNNEKIVDLERDCLTESDFKMQIGILATIVDDLDESALRSSLKGEYKLKGTINLLEKFLEENSLAEGDIIKNLRLIKRIRNATFPYHRGLEKEFLELTRGLGLRPPVNWKILWSDCYNLYINALTELLHRLDEYNSRIEYEKVEEEKIKKLEIKEEVIYLNDYLYKYRVLIPIKLGNEAKTLVDYLTAAIITYDRNLRYINYALRKYVKGLEGKFRKHAEDHYFVKKRRFVKNEFLKLYGILVSRDNIGIEDDKEFQRYFRHIWIALIAYYAGVTPDWLMRAYFPSYLEEGFSFRNSQKNHMP